MTAVLVRDDDLTELVLDGLLSYSIDRIESELADTPLASRDEIAYNLFRRPERAMLRCSFSDDPRAAGVATRGAARRAEVIGWLRRARDDGATCTLLIPGVDPVDDLVVLRVPEEYAGRASLDCSIELRAARFASTQTILLDRAPSPVAGSSSGPVSDVAPGMADDEDVGSRSSLIVALGASLGLL